MPSSLQVTIADDYSDPFDAKNDLKSKAGKGESTGYMEPYEAQRIMTGKHRHLQLRGGGGWVTWSSAASAGEGVYFGGGGWGDGSVLNLYHRLSVQDFTDLQEEPGRSTVTVQR